LTFTFFCRKIKYDKKGKHNGFRKKQVYRGKLLDEKLSTCYHENRSLVLVSKLTIDEEDGDWQRLDFEVWGSTQEINYGSLIRREATSIVDNSITLSKKVLERGIHDVMVVPSYKGDNFVYEIYN